MARLQVLWGGEYNKVWHVIKKRFWGPPNAHALTSLMVEIYCAEDAIDITPHKFNKRIIEQYDRDKHKEKACEKCVEIIKKLSP